MGKISDTDKYDYDSLPTIDDYVIGTDNEDSLRTKNYRIADIISLAPGGGGGDNLGNHQITQNMTVSLDGNWSIGTNTQRINNLYYAGQVRSQAQADTNIGYTALTSGGLNIQSSDGGTRTLYITNREGIVQDDRIGLRPYSHWDSGVLEYDYTLNRWRVQSNTIMLETDIKNVTDISGSVTLAPSNAVTTFTYTVAKAGYTRIGNLVFAYAQFNNIESNGESVDTFDITGFPNAELTNSSIPYGDAFVRRGITDLNLANVRAVGFLGTISVGLKLEVGGTIGIFNNASGNSFMRFTLAYITDDP